MHHFIKWRVAGRIRFMFILYDLSSEPVTFTPPSVRYHISMLQKVGCVVLLSLIRLFWFNLFLSVVCNQCSGFNFESGN